jgi:hypothetical protein
MPVSRCARSRARVTPCTHATGDRRRRVATGSMRDETAKNCCVDAQRMRGAEPRHSVTQRPSEVRVRRNSRRVEGNALVREAGAGIEGVSRRGCARVAAEVGQARVLRGPAVLRRCALQTRVGNRYRRSIVVSAPEAGDRSGGDEDEACSEGAPGHHCTSQNPKRHVGAPELQSPSCRQAMHVDVVAPSAFS